MMLLVLLAIFVIVRRQRLFVWDPLATVARDGVKQDHVRVMINYSNDVLLDDTTSASQGLYLVQHWNMAPRRATGVKGCIQYLACMTDADKASGEPIVSPTGAQTRKDGQPSDEATMTDRQVEFVDARGAAVLISLR